MPSVPVSKIIYHNTNRPGTNYAEIIRFSRNKGLWWRWHWEITDGKSRTVGYSVKMPDIYVIRRFRRKYMEAIEKNARKQKTWEYKDGELVE